MSIRQYCKWNNKKLADCGNNNRYDNICFQIVHPQTWNLSNFTIVMDIVYYNFKLGLRMSFKSLWKKDWVVLISSLFNPFVPNAPFLYPLKTSGNLTVLINSKYNVTNHLFCYQSNTFCYFGGFLASVILQFFSLTNHDGWHFYSAPP